MAPAELQFGASVIDPAGPMRRIPIRPWDGREETIALVATLETVSERAFALRVQGDAMESPHGRPTYPDGCIIIVDPDVEPVSGKRVVARLPGQVQLVFREWIVDGSVRYLRPLNRQYPAVQAPSETRILGVVVQTIMPE